MSSNRESRFKTNRFYTVITVLFEFNRHNIPIYFHNNIKALEYIKFTGIGNILLCKTLTKNNHVYKQLFFLILKRFNL